MPKDLKNHTLASQIAVSTAVDSAVETPSLETQFGQLASNSPRDGALKAEYLTGKNVLFYGNASHGIGLYNGIMLDGTVISVDEELKTAVVRFGFGFTGPITFETLVAVEDEDRGTYISIGRFHGRFIDLRT